MSIIDLNADLGEGLPTIDQAMMPYLSSCNIACGGHFGNTKTIKDAIILAKRYGVAIGAHPSYPDKENFGRSVPEIEAQDLQRTIEDQLQRFLQVCKETGQSCHHVKPHGALYNEAAKDQMTAEVICDAISSVLPKSMIYGLPQSCIETAALKYGLSFVAEAFADRQYEADGTLRHRKKARAVLNQNQAVKQVVDIALSNHVQTEAGAVVVRAQTICLHSDTKGAVSLAQSIRVALDQKGIQIFSV